MKTGDWVTDDEQVGRVKEVYPDGLIDIVLYSRAGERIGRTSPALGGPKGFEPCCSPQTWRRIRSPGFPLKPWTLREMRTLPAEAA